MTPAINELAEEFSMVIFLEVDVDIEENMIISESNGIHSFPACQLIKKFVISEVLGCNKSALRNEISKNA